MAKVVTVTRSQVQAAQLKVQRSTASGRAVPPGVTAIANPKRAPRPPSPRAQAH